MSQPIRPPAELARQAADRAAYHHDRVQQLAARSVGRWVAQQELLLMQSQVPPQRAAALSGLLGGDLARIRGLHEQLGRAYESLGDALSELARVAAAGAPPRFNPDR